MSTYGPVVRFLRAHAAILTTSELLDDVPPGEMKESILCEDVQNLTFDDDSFDVCTSTEVFEHVEDDISGFSEILRVLRAGGYIVFTVPLNGGADTIERTRLVDGRRARVMPDEYHGDRIRGRRVFCYRNYGSDILGRLEGVGFVEARIEKPELKAFGHERGVIVARKPFSRST
jgi:SAM-dependent methyltransferase